jgi:glycerol kinase
MTMSYIVGLDQGTTGTTALLFDANQKLIEKTSREHRQHFPQIGWVEHDPEEIFENTVSLISNLIKKAGIHASQIVGLGITNQRETCVVWDRNSSRPIYPAIVWQCRRTADLCEKMKKDEKLASKIQKTTGLTLDPYFSATKISWILKKIPRQKNIQLAAGTMDSWLIWNFTKGKVFATDMTNASRTLLFDIVKKQWSKNLCDQFEVPIEILSQVQPSISDFGSVHKSYFGHEIPILGVLGDQQASLFGHGAVNPYQAKCTFGTGAFALVHCGNQPLFSKNKLLTTLACSSDSKAQYALEGSVFMAGSIIQWLRDELKMINHASEMDELAKSVSTNEGVYLVPAFVGLGAPHWNPNAKGVLCGMHLGTNRSHIARASLEAIAYQVNDLLVAMEKDIGQNIHSLHVDGGVSNSHFLMQFLADILQIPIHRAEMFEMTAFGAAKAAATHRGFWKNSKKENRDSIFVPIRSASTMKVYVDAWKNAVKRTLFAP